MNTLVTCNYYFYDPDGNALTYPYTLTVSVIVPGSHKVYIYRKLGETTVEDTIEHADLKESGYTETTRLQRNDSVIVNKATNQKYAQVPMSYFNKADTLLFKYSNISLPDSIFVEHESYAHVDIPECGSYRYHNIQNIRSTQNAIDHLEIVNPLVNYDQESNVKIYFNITSTGE